MPKIICIGEKKDSTKELIAGLVGDVNRDLRGIQGMKQHQHLPKLEIRSASLDAGEDWERKAADVSADLVLLDSSLSTAEVLMIAMALREQRINTPIIAFSQSFAPLVGEQYTEFNNLDIQCAHTGRGVFELYRNIHEALGSKLDEAPSRAVS